MADGTEELRRDIEETRRNVGRDVDALSDKVSPRQMVGRRVSAVRSMMTRVMGTTGDTVGSATSTVGDKAGGMASGVTSTAGDMASRAGDMAGGVASKAGDMASRAGDAVQSAPQMARARTQGSPLAAGLVAFAGGWILASLLPASERERDLASGLDSAVDTVKEEVTEVAQDVRDNLREPAQEAVQHVRETAGEAASSVGDETKSAAGTVAGETKSSAENVRHA
jgi:hypothetical protein